MCPDRCPGLADVYGDKFTELYESYEKENRGIKVIKAREFGLKFLTVKLKPETLICFIKMLAIQNQIKKI